MNIFFLSTRISGTDGVSLEAEHWREILVRMGHKVTFIAGQLDRPGIILPELHFQSPSVVKIHDDVIYSKNSFKKIESKIFEIAGRIEGSLREVFNGGKKVDMLIVANALSLPMHFPLAVALTRVIEEFNIPTIARHHDFWWERERFLQSSLFPFFKRWFPPDLAQIKHVTINSVAQKELFEKKGIKSEVIGDSFDFDSKINKLDKFSSDWRDNFGIGKGDLVFLQATRIVPRKRVELAIELVKKLNNPNIILIVSGHSGDEGVEYEKLIRKKAKNAGIRFKFIGKYVNSQRRVVRVNVKGKIIRRKIFTLWDCFKNSDFIVYPTQKEGFGNQLVESVYFKKPLILTSYPVYAKDIKPLGFDFIEMDEKITEGTINRVNNLLNDKEERKEMVNRNFELGQKNLSYNWAENKLKKLLEV